jgi:hypothetical protein
MLALALDDIYAANVYKLVVWIPRTKSMGTRVNEVHRLYGMAAQSQNALTRLQLIVNEVNFRPNDSN